MHTTNLYLALSEGTIGDKLATTANANGLSSGVKAVGCWKRGESYVKVWRLVRAVRRSSVGCMLYTARPVFAIWREGKRTLLCRNTAVSFQNQNTKTNHDTLTAVCLLHAVIIRIILFSV